MTPEEIKKIAYYLSEKRHKEEETSENTTFIFPIEIYADIVSKLSERYCLVEKSKVLAEYKGIGEEVKCVNGRYTMTSDIPMIFQSKLRCIFGKDMFEEEGK